MGEINIAPREPLRRYCHDLPSPTSTPACDRCHAIKVKCVPSSTLNSCRRCFRLNHDCAYSRKRGTPGRRKKTRLGADPTTAKLEMVSSSSPLCSYTESQLIPEQDPLAPFYSMAAPFVPMLSAKVHTNIRRGPPILQDLYLALGRIMGRVQAGRSEHEKSDVLVCSRGLQVLRETRICDLKSLTSFLWLGIFLKSFDRLVLGTSTHLICETTLLQLRSWYSVVSADPEMMDPVVCLLFTDTVTALINRRIPVIKFKPQRPGIIDRYAGLCCDLLPLLYDACEVIASDKPANRLLDISAWNDVYERVNCWEPQLSPNIMTTFTPNELTILLTQAHAYRLATLLILHQARYPMEGRSNVRAEYAHDILSQMEACLLVAGEPPPHTVLPIFVAAMESSDTDKRTMALQLLQSCRGANYYPYMRRLRGMCSGFWSRRDVGGSSNWLTYLERFHPLNIPL